MKTLLFFFIGTLISIKVYPRQYIQCAEDNSFNRIVVNLNGDQSTLFMTNGVHIPGHDRKVYNIQLFDESSTFITYKSISSNNNYYIMIPRTRINTASRLFYITFSKLTVDESLVFEKKLGCFSSIHN